MVVVVVLYFAGVQLPIFKLRWLVQEWEREMRRDEREWWKTNVDVKRQNQNDRQWRIQKQGQAKTGSEKG